MSKPARAGRSLLSNWMALFIGIVISFFLSPYVVNKLGDALLHGGFWNESLPVDKKLAVA
jgi:hypothetical protein